MVADAISVIRANYVNLVSNVLNRSGISYHHKSILQQCYLPTSLKENPDAYVPLNGVLSFIRWAEYATGVKDIGLRAASRLTISDFNPELHSALMRSYRLDTAFKAFVKFVQYEQSNIQYKAIKKKNSIYFHCSLDSGQLNFVDRELEWFSIMSLVTIVRHFAGNDWTPAVINLHSEHKPGEFARRIFPDTEINTGHKRTGIEVHDSILNLEIPRNNVRVTSHAQIGAINDAPDETGEKVHWDFPTSLQKLLQSYLNDGYPDINFTAKIVGSSTRTLQRRLRQHSLRYSDLVHQTQIEYAKELLLHKGLRTLDIAYAAGYQDPANFTRAFRRLEGLSTKQFRIENYAH